jgi:ribosome-associated protein
MLQELGLKPLRSEGRAEAEWILLDFGDVIVHLFQSAPREFYGLERLWADAEKVDWVEPVVADG